MIINIPSGALSEVTGLRTKKSKTFDMGGGKFACINGMRPVHWRNGATLEDIDLNIKRRGQTYELTTAPYTVTVRWSTLTVTYEHEDGGSVSIQLTHINDTLIADLNPNFSPRLLGNKVFLDDFITGISLYLEAQDSGIAIQKLITQDIGPVSFTMRITHDYSPNVRIENRALGRDNYNEISDPDRITLKDSKRQLITSEVISGITDNGDGTESYTVRQEWLGQVSRTDPVTRIKSASNNVIYPVRMHVLVEETVATTADDGHEEDGTTWWSSGTDFFKAGRNSGHTFHGGLHFTTVAIPQGATIDDATLGFEVKTTFGTPQVTVYAEDTDDASAISSSNRPSQWTKTTASADATTALSSTGARTVDVTTIIQEIVDRGSWASNNDINLGLFHDGGGSGYQIGYIIDITTWGSQNFATLTVNYTAGGGGSNGLLLLNQANAC